MQANHDQMQANHDQMQANHDQLQRQMQAMYNQMQDLSRQTIRALNRNAVAPGDPIAFPPPPANAGEAPCDCPGTFEDFMTLNPTNAQLLCGWYNVVPLPPRGEQSRRALARLLGLRYVDRAAQ
mmetsp:Transcript_46521/g.93251  ORF Transcript_46521/g.93251 Transcript_46521/m.93251 type:complete len:124 (+) Transcript_46521:3-374(+)